MFLQNSAMEKKFGTDGGSMSFGGYGEASAVGMAWDGAEWRAGGGFC